MLRFSDTFVFVIEENGNTMAGAEEQLPENGIYGLNKTTGKTQRGQKDLVAFIYMA